MPCTTILVGKKATNDGSTMIARTDDGHFDVKKTVIVEPKDQPRKYKSVISHLEIELEDNPMRYSACPSVSHEKGTWAATGINACNVGMTATETTTTNPRVLAADPYVIYQKRKNRKEKDIPGGIGEEDIVVLVLPYIKSAREGVLRLGKLLEKYGTYESNGIAFNDENEVWWFESIGGHHWMARRVDDDKYVIMSNQFGLDNFDFKDAFGKQEANLCSVDLLDFINRHHLYLDHLSLTDHSSFNPRLAFGSDSDADHVYNNPRAWYMGRYFNRHSYKWEGADATYGPESNNIPWSFKPDRLITIEDIKYILSSYYQGTRYNPYQKADYPEKGIYRPIGINRTGVTSICQIRSDVKEELKGIEWIGYGSNAFNTFIPIYTSVSKVPEYLGKIGLDVSSDNFYWATRLIGALVDPNYGESIMIIERYQQKSVAYARQIIDEYDARFTKEGDLKLLEEANAKICEEVKKETQDVLNQVLDVASKNMKNGYSRSDN